MYSHNLPFLLLITVNWFNNQLINGHVCNVHIDLPKLSLHEREGPAIVGGERSYKSGSTDNDAVDSGNVFMCYYGFWAQFRKEAANLPIDMIDTSLCTHIIYAFAGIDHESRLKSLHPMNELVYQGSYTKLTNLKKINPKLKILLSVGGWNEGSFRYSNMAANLTARKNFAKTSVQMLQKYNFDGLDLSWEFPSTRGGKPEDKRNFAALLQELNQVLKPHNFLLTAALSANKFTIDGGYDVSAIARFVDYMNIMTYDYHGGWETRTGHNSPLYSRPHQGGIDGLLNINYSINYWISKGAPKSKILLGIPFFGRSFTLVKNDQFRLGASTSSKGRPGPFIEEAGSLAYHEICSLQKKENWTVIMDPYNLAPFAFNGDQWVGYDDAESVALKVRYMKGHGLGGVFVWSIENDDVNGVCSNTKFPLVKAIHKELMSPNKTIPLPRENDDRKPDLPSSERPWTWSSTSPNPWSWTPSTHSSSSSSPWWTPSTSGSSSTWWNPSTSASPSTWWPSTSSTPSSTWWPRSSTASSPASSTSTTTVSPSPSPSPSSSPSLSSTVTSSKPETEKTASSSVSTPPTGSEMTTKLPGIDKGVVCKYPGTFIHPYDCKKFYRCVRISIREEYKIYEYTCPANTIFDVDSQNCLWDYLVTNCRINRDNPRKLQR